MPFNDRAMLGAHREIAFERRQGFMHPIDHVASGIEDGLARQAPTVREPQETILVDIAEGLGGGEIHADVVAWHVDDRGDVVARRRERLRGHRDR
jgi:hypothetical protein